MTRAALAAAALIIALAACGTVDDAEPSGNDTAGCDGSVARSMADASRCPCGDLESVFCWRGCNDALELPPTTGICVRRCAKAAADDEAAVCDRRPETVCRAAGRDRTACLPPLDDTESDDVR